MGDEDSDEEDEEEDEEEEEMISNFQARQKSKEIEKESKNRRGERNYIVIGMIGHPNVGKSCYQLG